MTAVQPTAVMSGRYQRAFTIAVVFLVGGWHLAGAGGQLLHNRSAYGSFAFQGAMWLVMALAITVGSVLVLRGAPGWRPAWAVAVIALAASTAAAAASPAGQMLAVNWAWGSAGWTGVLVLHRRRFAELSARGAPQTFAQVLSEMEARDHADSTRADSPLRDDGTYACIDTSSLSVEEVADRVLSAVGQGVPPPG